MSSEVPAGQIAAEASGYEYLPSEAAAITFIVLFTVSALVHIYQGVRGKYWIVFPTLVTGALVEALGWGGRLWSSQDIMKDTPFMMQISCLIMAPVFFSAYLYTVVGMALTALGPVYSLLTPKWYLIIFLTADVVSLIMQAVGGGIASSADAAKGDNMELGPNIMLAGIVFQLGSMLLFICVATDFIYRVHANKPYAFRQRKQLAPHRTTSDDTLVPSNSEVSGEKVEAEQVMAKKNLTRWWIFLVGGVGISSLAIILRGAYRTAELSQGWGGSIMDTQNFQNFLDGLPMVIAVAIFNFINPTYLLPNRASWKGIH